VFIILTAFALRLCRLDFQDIWRDERGSAVGYTVTTQLLDANGMLRGQRDQTPGDDSAPITSWLPAEYLTDVYHNNL